MKTTIHIVAMILVWPIGAVGFALRCAADAFLWFCRVVHDLTLP